MSATLYTLQRHTDVSGVSGEGPVATVCEFSSGLTAMHWDSDTPSVAVHTDIRHIAKLHGHSGASVLEIHEPDRLIRAYRRVMPWLLSARYHDRPTTCEPHPDHPDRLLLIFTAERVWRFWIALLDGSTDTTVHEGPERRWVSPDGDLWLTYRLDETEPKDNPEGGV